MTDEEAMLVALSLANSAGALGEVPVGAVIVKDGAIVATGINQREKRSDATAHAEILALQAACDRLQTWRLADCTLYVTLEPCVMCAGALWQARIGKVVYGALDPKGGALGSLFSLHADKRLNHRYEVIGGLRARDSAELLKTFFKARRKPPS